MSLNDDSNIATVVKETVRAMKDAAHLIGKIRPDPIDTEQVKQIEAAIQELQNALKLQKGR